MGSDNVFGIELPKDAEGKVIPLDTEVLCSQSGKVFEVEGFRYSLKIKEWFAYGRYRLAERSGCGETNRFLLTPPDSWDKLIDDLRSSTGRYMAACAYFNQLAKIAPNASRREQKTAPTTRSATSQTASRSLGRVMTIETREDDNRLHVRLLRS